MAKGSFAVGVKDLCQLLENLSKSLGFSIRAKYFEKSKFSPEAFPWKTPAYQFISEELVPYRFHIRRQVSSLF